MYTLPLTVNTALLFAYTAPLLLCTLPSVAAFSLAFFFIYYIHSAVRRESPNDSRDESLVVRTQTGAGS